MYGRRFADGRAGIDDREESLELNLSSESIDLGYAVKSHSWSV